MIPRIYQLLALLLLLGSACGRSIASTKLEIAPADSTVSAGATVQLTATAIFSDGVTRDVTAEVAWSSSSESIATVAAGLVKGVGPGAATITGTFNEARATASITVATPNWTAVSLEVAPSSAMLAIGATQAFVATGIGSDGSRRNVTTQVSWQSTDARVASIDSGGLATAHAAGLASLTAKLGQLTANAVLTVAEGPGPVLVSLSVTPVTAQLQPGGIQLFQATGTYSDFSRKDLTSQVTWTSSDEAVASILTDPGSRGEVKALAVGVTQITAQVGNVEGAATLRVVSPLALVAIEISPSAPSIARGTTLQFGATGIFSDGTRQPLSAVTWASSAPASASITSSGMATGLAAGTASISATQGSVTGRTLLTVKEVSLTSIAVTPVNPSIANGTSIQLTAMGTFSDGSTQNLTSQAMWNSMSPASVSVVAGRATGLQPGPVTLSASHSGVVGSTVVTVLGISVVSISITPQNPALARGTSLQLEATALLSNGSTQDVTSQALWTSSSPTIASLSMAPGSQGLVQGVNVGTTTVTASLGMVSGSATVRVTPATLTELDVAPRSLSLPAGTHASYIATGHFSDGSVQNLTQQVTWSTANSAVATISNALGSVGRLTAVAQGVTSVRAALGPMSVQVQVTVFAATLTALDVTPSSAVLVAGARRPFLATGIYSNGATQDLTTQVTWTSGTSSVATISNQASTEGIATAIAAGSSTITATLGALSDSATLTVSPATLVLIEVTPIASSISIGISRQFAATGIYSDDSVHDLTALVTWSSSNASVASISNGSSTRGLARANARGTTTIGAALGAVTGSTVLTVNAAELISIDIYPQIGTLALGTGQQLQAYGSFDDGSFHDLTSQVIWSSTSSARVSVSNAAPNRGFARGVSLGTADVSASLGGMVGTTTIEVTSAIVVSIAVQPTTPNAAQGAELQMTAWGIFSDGSVQELTGQVTWSSTAPLIARVSNAPQTKGLTTAVGQGVAFITASLNGIGGSTSLTVLAPALTSIAITPADSSMGLTDVQQLTATGTFTNGATQDLTAQVTWASSNRAVAQVANAAGSQGVAHALSIGRATITARYLGVTGQTSITVTSAILQSILVEPSFTSMIPGTTLQFTATGFYSDGSQQNITSRATWSSTALGVATISSGGVVTAIANGSADLRADYGGQSGVTTLTVASPVSILVEPTNPVLRTGRQVQFRATAIFFDGSSQDVTATASWTSSQPTIASVSNSGATKGQCTGVAVGTASILAVQAGVGGSTTVTVTP